MKPLLTVYCPGLMHRNFTDQATLARIKDLPVEFLYLVDNDWVTLAEKTRRLIDMARADWVCGMGDDDLLHPQFFDKILPLVKTAVQMIGFNVSIIGDKGPPLECRVNPGWERSPERWEGKIQYRPYAMVCPIRKIMLTDIDWPATSYGEDHDIIEQVGPRLSTWKYLGETLYYAFPRMKNPDRKDWSRRYE